MNDKFLACTLDRLYQSPVGGGPFKDNVPRAHPPPSMRCCSNIEHGAVFGLWERFMLRLRAVMGIVG